MPTHLILTKTLSSIHKHNSSFTDKATIQRVQGPCSRSHTWYVAELWVRPGRLIPEPVLLTPEVHVDPWSSRGHSWVSVLPKASLLQILDEMGHWDFLMCQRRWTFIRGWVGSCWPCIPSSGVEGAAWAQPACAGWAPPSSPLHLYNGVWSP